MSKHTLQTAEVWKQLSHTEGRGGVLGLVRPTPEQATDALSLDTCSKTEIAVDHEGRGACTHPHMGIHLDVSGDHLEKKTLRISLSFPDP